MFHLLILIVPVPLSLIFFFLRVVPGGVSWLIVDVLLLITTLVLLLLLVHFLPCILLLFT